MKQEKFHNNEDDIYRICFLGSCAVGKTSIINRIINNSFTQNYDPTLELTSYSTEFQPRKNIFVEDPDDTNDNYQVILEDMFGLNNTIIQTPPQEIKSANILRKRAKMIDDFKSVIYSYKEINLASQENLAFFHNSDMPFHRISFKTSIPRTGLIFVVDITDEDTLNEAISIINQIEAIEKNEKDYKTEKAIFLNKFDKISENKKINDLQSKLSQKEIYHVYEISALSDWNITESMSNFLGKIQQRFFGSKADAKQEEIYHETEVERSGGCFGNNGIFCGSSLFSCGRGDN